MHALLVPFGSHGDVHPFLGLARALRSRGHRVTFLISEYFVPLLSSLGVDTIPLGEPGLFRETLRNADLWHPRRAFPIIASLAVEHARLALPIIRAMHVPGESVVVGGSLAVVARLATETTGMPMATVHLQPAVLHSDFDPPVYPGFETPRWWPVWFRRRFFDFLFSKAVAPHIEPVLNAYRAELGLAPVRDVFRTWVSSPDLALGFFPSWFGPPQRDWPPNVELCGFPLFDESEVSPMSPDLVDFLGSGTPPIAFTPGSANLHGRPFFEAAVDACGRLNRRGLLLTRHAEQVPENLPPGIRHVDYAPFSQLLPRVAALVHHGGIGTAAQGMAAGVPQLVMPLGHDQYDNAARMRRLGVGRELRPGKFRGPAVARELRPLLESTEIAAHCRAVAAKFAEDFRPMDRASAAIERLVGHVTVAGPTPGRG
jgi:rhamnosyltransferase subunit B